MIRNSTTKALLRGQADAAQSLARSRIVGVRGPLTRITVGDCIVEVLAGDHGETLRPGEDAFVVQRRVGGHQVGGRLLLPAQPPGTNGSSLLPRTPAIEERDDPVVAGIKPEELPVGATTPTFFSGHRLTDAVLTPVLVDKVTIDPLITIGPLTPVDPLTLVPPIPGGYEVVTGDVTVDLADPGYRKVYWDVRRAA